MLSGDDIKKHIYIWLGIARTEALVSLLGSCVYPCGLMCQCPSAFLQGVLPLLERFNLKPLAHEEEMMIQALADETSLIAQYFFDIFAYAWS